MGWLLYCKKARKVAVRSHPKIYELHLQLCRSADMNRWCNSDRNMQGAGGRSLLDPLALHTSYIQKSVQHVLQFMNVVGFL
jgi:hypothetical protein